MNAGRSATTACTAAALLLLALSLDNLRSEAKRPNKQTQISLRGKIQDIAD